MDRICSQCGTDISERHKNTKYCGTCYPKRHKLTSDIWKQTHLKSGQYKCQTCGKTLSPPSRVNIPKQCKECYIKNMPKGSNSPTWKGGRFIVNGYVYIQCDSSHIWARKQHPGITGASYYAPEHVINWEKVHGIKLLKTWVIHHLNGIKSDNRPSNLMALPRTKHSGHERIKVLQKKIRELEAIISQQQFQI